MQCPVLHTTVWHLMQVWKILSKAWQNPRKCNSWRWKSTWCSASCKVDFLGSHWGKETPTLTWCSYSIQALGETVVYSILQFYFKVCCAVWNTETTDSWDLTTLIKTITTICTWKKVHSTSWNHFGSFWLWHEQMPPDHIDLFQTECTWIHL